MSRIYRISDFFLRIPAAPQAALFMIAACLFLSALGGMIREVSDSGMPVFQLVFLRNVAGLLVLAPWFLRNGFAGLKTTRPGLHLLRSLTGFMAMLTWFYAVSTIALADAVALNFTAPLFGTLLAILVLKETVRLRRWIAIIVGFLGAMVILRPGMMEMSPGVIAALVSAGFMAASITSVKILSRTDRVPAIVAWTQIIILPMSAVPALMVWQNPTLEQWLWVGGIGFFATMGHLCFTRSFSLADATYVMPFDFFRLIFSAFIGYMFFAQTPDIFTWIGGCIIFASAVYIAYRESRTGKVDTLKQAAPEQVDIAVRPGPAQ